MMNNQISRELANVILGKYYDSLQAYNTEKTIDNNTMSLNDFTCECKKYILSKGFKIKVYYNTDSNEKWYLYENYKYDIILFVGNNVFEAAEYVISKVK